jgi:putative endonuclease
MTKYYVYILRSIRTGWLYTGHTKDLTDRLKRHNNNEMPATKNRGPFEIVYTEEYATRSAAMQREKFLKTGRGRKVRDSLIGA